MNFDELNQLLAKNQKRVAQIEKTFFDEKNAIKSYNEVIKEMKENWTTKEKYKTCSTSYPSYGRGLQPNINMNTFMVQEGMAKTKE